MLGVRALVGGLLAAALLAPLPVVGAAPPAKQGTVVRGEHADAHGTRSYRLFLPGGKAKGPRPLLVHLHGCTESADVTAARSRFDDVGQRLGVMVLYPEQDPAANGGRCWNWFHPDHQRRDAGEPALLAGMTRAVQQRYAADPSRTYAFGISAGAAMTEILSATHPDLFAAVGVYAGCTYRGLPCAGTGTGVPYQQSAQWAREEGGSATHVMPVFVVQGDADPAVPPQNSEWVVQEHLALADLLAGEEPPLVPRPPTATRTGAKPGGRGYTVDTWTAGSCDLAVRWTVHGLGHAWSNAPADTGDPNRDLLFNDPSGPDVTTPAVEFLLGQRAGDARCRDASL